MIRRYVIYFLTTLIALQSVVAMADIHQLYQAGVEPVLLAHDAPRDEFVSLTGELETVRVAASDTFESCTSGSLAFDCHLCCHCHALVHVFLLDSQLPLTARPTGIKTVTIHRAYASLHFSPDNPPPIR